MRPASQSIWTLIGASAYSAVARAAGVLDIGLAFPRANGTYEATEDFPIVFALQNSELAEHLQLSTWYQIINMTRDERGDLDILVDENYDLNWNSVSQDDPYFLWNRLRLQGEGKFRVLWQSQWSSCNETSDGIQVARNQSNNFLVDFELKEDGDKADLIAVMDGDSADCPNEGVTINVADGTLEAPAGSTGSREPETCAVLDSPSPTSTSNPCKVQIDKAAVESMDAAALEKKCRGLNPPDECPEEEGLANPRLVAVGVSSLAAVVGAVLFLV